MSIYLFVGYTDREKLISAGVVLQLGAPCAVSILFPISVVGGFWHWIVSFLGSFIFKREIRLLV